jgi:hypothetical protein
VGGLKDRTGAHLSSMVGLHSDPLKRVPAVVDICPAGPMSLQPLPPDERAQLAISMLLSLTAGILAPRLHPPALTPEMIWAGTSYKCCWASSIGSPRLLPGLTDPRPSTPFQGSVGRLRTAERGVAVLAEVEVFAHIALEPGALDRILRGSQVSQRA